MGLTASTSTTDNFPPKIQPGAYPARCVQVIDKGTQYSDWYKNHKPKVMLGWEIPSVLDPEDGKPVLVWQTYTLSLHENANLRKVLEMWRSKQFTPSELEGFHLRNVLDRTCTVTVVHKPDEKDPNNIYVNVGGVSAAMVGMPIPDRVHNLILFDLEATDLNMAAWETFHDKLKTKIASSPEGKDRGLVAPLGDSQQGQQPAMTPMQPQTQQAPVAEDDIPF